MTFLKIVTISSVLLLLITASYFLVQRSSLAPQLESITLIVGTCDDYPPYTFQKEGKLVGFDIDLITQVAQRMSKKIEFKNITFDLLLLELMRGSIHVVAAGISPTPERAKRVLFSDLYVQGDPFVILCNSIDNIKSIQGCFGKKTGVNEGYTADQYVSGFSEIIVSRFDTIPTGLLALSSKKIDAFVSSNNSITPFVQHQKNHNFTITQLPNTQEICAFAVSKHYPELIEKINAILLELEEDGTMMDLKKKWALA